MELLTGLWDAFMSERLCLFRTVAAGVGVVWLLRTAFCTLSFLCPFIKAYILAPRGIFRPDLKKYGPWAVVTGGSEGIGRAIAIELAKRGLNVVIMSRSQEKLDTVANEIRDKYKVQVRVVVVDFSSGLEIYPEVARQLQDLDIGILVNNVGVSYEHADYFLAVPREKFYKMIEINCQSMVQMTYSFLPKMIEKKRGLVINISSLSGLFPLALLTVYSATKSFVVFFSDGLDQEYSSKGIVVQCITPGLVATAMSGIKKPKLLVPSASSFASSALNTVGHYRCTGGSIPHAMQNLLFNLWPSKIKKWANESMKKSRDRALKRKEREKKE